MPLPHRSTFVVVALCISTLLPSAKAAAQAQVRVIGTDLFANGKLAPTFQYSGACPVWLRFYWSLATSEYTGVGYYFQTNTGIRTPGRRDYVSPSMPLAAYIDWHVGLKTPKLTDQSGWLELHVMYPNVFANTINYTIHCR